MDYILCFGIWLVIGLAALTIYRRFYRFGYWDREHYSLYFDRSDPGDVYEAGCIQEQRRWGRERGGPLVWMDED